MNASRAGESAPDAFWHVCFKVCAWGTCGGERSEINLGIYLKGFVARECVSCRRIVLTMSVARELRLV